MELTELIRSFPHDPYTIIHVSPAASDEEIAEAYEKCKKDDLTDRAYKIIRTEENRILYRILSLTPLSSDEELLNITFIRPEFKGPGLWYNTLLKND